jgi:hypothetical protein
MESNEKTYWQHKAALLDPKAYVLKAKNLQGSAFFEVVPQGECWYVISAFYVRIASGLSRFTHRVPDVDQATMLTAGTRIEFHPESQWSMYLTCRPALVVGVDQRYEDDPRGLYFERMQRLRVLPSFNIRAQVASGTPYGSNIDVPFPADFETAMCLAYSSDDVSWAVLAGTATAMNLGNEVSDDHQNRIGQRVLFPFSRAMFPALRTRGCSVSGAVGEPYIYGNGQIVYCKLPADW